MKILLTIISVFCNIFLYSQQQWSLDKCIEHALNNNLSLKSNQLEIEKKIISKNQVKLNYLPNLNGEGTHGYNWGQSIDPFTNEFASNRVQTNNLFLGTNWSIFSGLENYYLSQKASTEHNYALYNEEVLQRNLKIDVTAHYLQVVLNGEALEIAKEQLVAVKNQKKRIQQLVNVQKKTNFDLLELETQLALDSLILIKANSKLKVSKIRLKQFLNLSKGEDFDIFTDKEYRKNFLLSDKENLEINSLAEIKRIEAQERLAETNFNIHKSKSLPRLSLSSSLGSGYSGNNKEIRGLELVPKSFNTQLDENFYQSATLSLNIPIFNRGTIRANAELAKIEILKMKVKKEQTIIELEYKIEQLKIEINNASAQLNVSKTALNTAKKSFENTRVKYEEGFIHFANYTEAKKKLFEAQSEFIQAEFQYLFKQKLLSYYF